MIGKIPVKVEKADGWYTWHACGVCNRVVHPGFRFCPYCGTAIDWSHVKGVGCGAAD